MATFTDAQVAAYFRDNKLDTQGIANAAKVFGVGQDQIDRANGLLQSGNAAVQAASDAYQASVTPEQHQQNLAFYDSSTGMGSAAAGLPQTQKQADTYYQNTYGWTNDNLDEAKRGQLGLSAGDWSQQDLDRFAQQKGAQDQYMIASNMAGRINAPSQGAVFRSGAQFNPQSGLIEVRDSNGVLLTQIQPSTTGSEFNTLDRLGVDPTTYRSATDAYLKANPGNAKYISSMAQKYTPRHDSVPMTQYLRGGVDPAKDASPFFASQANMPSVAEFMRRAGVDNATASNMLYSNGLGSAASALVDWDAVMAARDPVNALNGAYAAIAADPNYSRMASQAVSQDYKTWNMDGQPVAGSAAGGAPGAGGAGGAGGGATNGSTGLLGTSTGGVVGNDNTPVTPFTREVDAPTETIEGRIQNLLGTDANGNFTNSVVKQAADHAMAQFASRGLLNSSMAQQAAQQAAMSKAIEIAGPDAQTYFAQQGKNQDAVNVFRRAEQDNIYDTAKLNKQLELEWAKLDQQDKQYYTGLQARMDELRLSDENQKLASQVALQNDLAKQNTTAVQSQYDLFVRRLAQIDADTNLDAAAKAKQKNEAAANFKQIANYYGVMNNFDLNFGTQEPQP